MKAPAAVVVPPSFAILAALLAGGFESRATAAPPKPVPLRAHAFDLKQVRLLEGPFKYAMERDRRYLHALESERLLYKFREKAGLPAPGEPMGGWEALEVRGHSLGHYLSACAMMVASTGDEKLKAKAEQIVTELARCQAALGDSGYLSAFPESFIERAEKLQRVWAPYYTLHKTMAGLLDMYLHCDNQQALDVLQKMAAWCKSRCDKLSDDQMQAMLKRTEPGVLASELSPNSQESCCTYNMLKLTRRLFMWDPQPIYADYYERALYNSILSTQDPETGMMMYFVALKPGHWKVYNTPRDSFWCCTGTGMENHAKYGDSIYFSDDAGLFVNLFIPSELAWPEKGLRLRQETRFPENDTTTLLVDANKAVELAVRIRVPYWAMGGVAVKVNGQPQTIKAKPASYVVLDRTWRDGDRVEVILPMGLHLHRMPDDPTLATVMYGPLVLAGELGAEKLTSEMFYAKRQRDYDTGPSIEAPIFVVKDHDPNSWIEPAPGRPLAFRTVGVGQPNDVKLVPYHTLFGQRYSVYWRIAREGSEQHRRLLAEQATRQARRARTVDAVEIGMYPSEKEHELKGQNMAVGRHNGRNWRHASDGGWILYTMRVLPDAPMILSCTYWGSDTGARTFDVLVDDRKIATQKLDRDKPDKFFEVEYPIPAELTRGKEQVAVKFQAHRDHTAGGVFGCEMLKPAQ